MTTSIDGRSGSNNNEDKDAVVCEEVQICDICGDAGYDDELAVCSRCNDSAEHIYCMSAMHDTMPLRWVCEQCESEEKKDSSKKRFAGNEPLFTQGYKKQITKELSSCSAMSEAKNILKLNPPLKPISCESRTLFPSILSANLIAKIEPNSNSSPKQNITGAVVSSSVGLDKKLPAVETQVHEGSNMSKNVSSSLEGRHAVEARLSTFEQSGTAVLSSATLRGPSGCLKIPASGETNIKLASEIKTAREYSVKGNVDTAPKGASNRARVPADGLLSGSKRVFSRSVSMESNDDQPSFLLPSRSKNLTRSKSAVVRPSACWIGDKGYHKELPLAMHERARWRTSCIMDSTKSALAGPTRQAGQERIMDYDRSSRDLESTRLWGHNFDLGKETNNRSSRDSEFLQHGSSTEKESLRCYRCGEVGHIGARCKNVSSGRPQECESSRRLSEKSMAGSQARPESPLGLRLNKEGGSLKESSSWMSQHVDSSGTWPKSSSNTSEVQKNSGKERHDRTKTVNTNKEEGILEESSSWKSHGAHFSRTCSKLSPNTSQQQIKNSGKERLDRKDTVNMAVKLSRKPSENALVFERHVAQVQVLDGQKGNVATSSSPSISFETGKQVSTQDIATLQQARRVDAVMDKHLCVPQPNQVVLSHTEIKCASATATSTAELNLVVDTTFDSYCEIRADPCVEVLWSGCFNVSSNNCLITYKGLQAHPSTKADPRVFEAIKTLPFELYLEELKRGLETDTWPRSLLEQPPTSNSIGVYFFPVDMECHDMWYKPLLDHLSANDLALKTNLNLFQLLIFPSQLLPQAEQCWEDRQYLWGILRRGTSFKTLSTATLGDSL